MRLFYTNIFVLLLVLCLTRADVSAQTSKNIHWISFAQLNDSLQVNPKPVFVDFYADWCTYCKEMDRTTFADEKVIDLLNNSYYAVKMNVESRDQVVFGGQTFVNKRDKRINPIHEIALLMASRKNKPFSLPAYVVLDKNFSATARYFQFLDTASMLDMLSKEKLTGE